MGSEHGQKICLKCHDARARHRWLAQMDLHFRFLECASCHALDAKLGMVRFSLTEASHQEGLWIIAS